MVREQLLQAEIYVYETDGKILGFVGLQGDYLAGIFVDRHARSMGIGGQLIHYVQKIRRTLTLNVYRKKPERHGILPERRIFCPFRRYR